MPFNSGGLNGGTARVPAWPAPGAPEAVAFYQSPIRDWDVYEDVAAKLEATGEFDLVRVGTTPEQEGTGEAVYRGAFVLPGSWTETELDPEFNERHGTYSLVLTARDDDPRTRDRALDRLVGVAANALVGQSFCGGQTTGRDSKLTRGDYQPPDHPERRMTLHGTFSYLVGNNAGHSTGD